LGHKSGRKRRPNSSKTGKPGVGKPEHRTTSHVKERQRSSGPPKNYVVSPGAEDLEQPEREG